MEHINSSSVSISWDNALGDFDFHRITVANTSVTDTITVHKEERVAVVVGLLDGCTYNVSVERVRGAKAGSAASLTVTTGRYGHKRSNLLLLSALFSFTFFSFFCPCPVSSSLCARSVYCKCICSCILITLAGSSGLRGSLPSDPTT